MAEILYQDFLVVVEGDHKLYSDYLPPPVAHSINSDARIWSQPTNSISCDAKIIGRTQETIDSDAHIKGVNSNSIDMSGHIYGTYSQDISSDANISNRQTEDIDLDAWINNKSITMDALIYVPTNKSINMDGVISDCVGGEDFLDDYVEVDPSGRVTLTHQKTIWATTSTQNEFVYRDFGVDYFKGCFEFWVEAKVDTNLQYIQTTLVSLSNTVDHFSDCIDALGVYLGAGISYSGSNPPITIKERYQGKEYSVTWQMNQSWVGIPYYYKIIRDESVGFYGQGQLSLQIYSDYAMSVLVHTLTLDLHKAVDYRYLFSLQPYASATSGGCSGYIKCLKLSPTTLLPSEHLPQTAGIWEDGLEDLSTYWKVDPNNRWYQHKLCVETFYCPTTDDSYVYKDFGVGYFSSYSIDFNFYIDDLLSCRNDYPALGLWAVTNSPGSYSDMLAGHMLTIWWPEAGVLQLRDKGTGLYANSAQGFLTSRTTYYVHMVRNGLANLRCYLYHSAEDRRSGSNLWLMLEVNGCQTTLWQYMQIGFTPEKATYSDPPSHVSIEAVKVNPSGNFGTRLWDTDRTLVGNTTFIDSSNNIHTAYYSKVFSSTSYDLRYAVSTDGGVTFTNGEGGSSGSYKTLLTSTQPWSAPSIVVDSTGKIFVFFINYAQELYFLKKSGTWDAAVKIHSSQKKVRAEVDSNDNIIVASCGDSVGSNFLAVHTSSDSGASWVENIDSSTQTAYVDMCPSNDTNMWILHHNSSSFAVHKLSRSTWPYVWTLEAEENTGSVYNIDSMAISCDKTSETVWLFRAVQLSDVEVWSLQYCKRVAGVWDTSWTTIEENTDGYYENLTAVRADDDRIFLMFGVNGTNIIYYIPYDNGSWHSRRETQLVGNYGSIQQPRLKALAEKCFYSYVHAYDEGYYINSFDCNYQLESITSGGHIKAVASADINSAASICTTRGIYDIGMAAILKGTHIELVSQDALIMRREHSDIQNDCTIRGWKDFEGRARLQNSSQQDFETQFKVDQPIPIVPTLLEGEDVGTGDAVYLHWTDMSNYGYNIYKKVGVTWEKQNTAGIHRLLNFTAGSLTEGVPYTFTVRGCNGVGDESVNSNEVIITPTFQKDRTPSYKIYINGSWRQDAILKQVELVYGPSFSSATFELLKPVASAPSESDTIYVEINNKRVFTGTIVTKDDTLEAQNQSITYTAVCDLWKYTWDVCGRDFNTTEDQEAGWYWFTQGITNAIGVPGAPINNFPGSVSIKDSTKLDAMVTILGYCGNYKIYTDPYGNVSYYHIGTGSNRTLEVGKQILAQNIRTDISDKVDQVTVIREWSYRDEHSFFRTNLDLVLSPSKPGYYYVGSCSGYRIGDVRLDAQVRPAPVIEYSNIEVLPGHCRPNASGSSPLTTWVDGSTTPKAVVKTITPATENWQGVSAEIVYKNRDLAEVYIPYGTQLVTDKINTHTYIATFYTKDGVAVEETVEVADDIGFNPALLRVTYSVENKVYQQNSLGSGPIKRTFHDDNIDSDIASRANAEYEKLSKPTSGGEILILGDETIDLRTRVNGYDVMRVTHDFGEGFTTRINLTNEPYYRGVLNNARQQEQNKTKEKAKDTRTTLFIQYLSDKKESFLSGLLGEDPNAPKKNPKENLGTSSYSD